MENPVFFDATGRRWKVVKTFVLLLIVAASAAVIWMVPQIVAPVNAPSLQTNVSAFERPVPFAADSQASILPAPMTNLTADTIRDSNTAVIGKGPLVRVIKLQRIGNATYSVDPFSNDRLGVLTPAEITYINGDAYALERYGKTNGKRIVLTFDDGPDPVYTPQILDILSRENARASFFIVGSQVVKNSEIARRIVREGHTIGNHTFSHINFDFTDTFIGEQEINQTQRITLAATGNNMAFFRPPYVGDSDQSLRDSASGIIAGQKLGYAIAIYDYDSNDWQYTGTQQPKFPAFDGSDHVVLVHDGGGDRSRTVEYITKLIAEAKKQGYSFASLNDLYPASSLAAAAPSSADTTALQLAEIAIIWPKNLIHVLFGFNIVMILSTTALGILLATLQRRRFKPRARKRGYNPSVTIIVPAYNEGRVIERSVKSLLDSSYRKLSIVIVDDGSTDSTWEVAQKLARKYKRVSALHQINSGKANALNNAIERSKDEVIVCVDADTVFPRHTLNNLVRHFENPQVGAVAGVVKVGNVSSILTRWQMLEYATSISLERNAQAYLGAVTIVPGACGAWRRLAIGEAGGFNNNTLAEDCDLTLRIQRLKRYKILQDNDAIGFTEAPQDLHSFVKQRFRWTFGNIQALWRQRAMIDDPSYGWLGCLIIPVMVVGILTPLIFWPLLLYLLVQNLLSGNYIVIVAYATASLLVQFIVTIVGLKLAGERVTNLHAIFYARLIYSPIRTYILYRSIWTMLRGRYVSWSKLIRTGTVNNFDITKIR